MLEPWRSAIALSPPCGVAGDVAIGEFVNCGPPKTLVGVLMIKGGRDDDAAEESDSLPDVGF